MENYYLSKDAEKAQQNANKEAKGFCSNNPNKEITHKLAESIIANQIALNYNHEIRFTPWYKKELKHYLNKALEILYVAERREFDDFFNKEENASVALYNAQDQMCKTICRIGLQNFGVINQILLAYESNLEELEAFIDKLNNNK